MKYIKLTQNKRAIVDDEDFEFLNQWKWHYNAQGYQGYAIRRKWFGCEKSKLIRMHRLINNTPNKFETDHINKNKLDNRKCNLRTVTRSQNMMNKNNQINNTSGYTGVVRDKKRKKWQAQIMLNQKNIFLGYFINKQDAIKARKQGEKLYFLI